MFGIAATAEQSRHFFDLAATVMPIVLFGSVLARAFKPPEIHRRLRWYHSLFALAIALYVGFVATAEVFAVAAAVDGGAERVLRIYISIALVIGVFGFGLAITVPWAIRFRREGQRYGLATIVVAIAFLISFAWGSVNLLDFANRGSLSADAKTELGRTLRTARHAELEWLRAELRARSDHRVSPLEQREITILRERKQAAKKMLKAHEQR